MANSDDGQLMRLIGEISADTKHILLRQDKQDLRIDKIQNELSTVEAFQWKLTGIALTVPAVIATIGMTFKYILPQ